MTSPSAYEVATLRTAFCILPRNLDQHLSFYLDVLGLQVIRRDEGFVRFNTSPAIICLWEIGHIHKHLGFTDPGRTASGSKSIVYLEVPDSATADTMAEGCMARGLAPLPLQGSDAGGHGFMVCDPNGNYWSIRVRPGAQPAQVARYGVLAEDFEASLHFYRDVMNLRPLASTADSAAFAVSDAAAIEVVRRSSVPGIAPLSEAARRAHLTMPALGYRRCAEVDAAAARLRRGGARLTADPAVHEWNFYVAYFTDPDANIWEIFTPLPEGTTSLI